MCGIIRFENINSKGKIRSILAQNSNIIHIIYNVMKVSDKHKN